MRAVRARYLARSRGISWDSLHRVAALRKRYVPHYARCLADAAAAGAAGAAGGGGQEGGLGGDSVVASMDSELGEATILVFRCVWWGAGVGASRRGGATA